MRLEHQKLVDTCAIYMHVSPHYYYYPMCWTGSKNQTEIDLQANNAPILCLIRDSSLETGTKRFLGRTLTCSSIAKLNIKNLHYSNRHARCDI